MHTLTIKILAISLFCTSAQASNESEAFVGKNEWLFYKREISVNSDQKFINKSTELIGRFNEILNNKGIKLLVVLVPLKMRTYSEYLPENFMFSDFLMNQYDHILTDLESKGVITADLNTAFANATKRISEPPLFFRLDTHWTPTGAMVAAQAIRYSLTVRNEFKTLMDTVPTVTYSIKIANRKRPSKGRDLVKQLPEGSPTFEPEMMAQVNVIRASSEHTDLQNSATTPQITLMGSSYSNDWTGFPDALRFTLQRDIASISVNADQGSWVGMESYLRDESFQKQPPKILIWELPERDMKAAPDYKFREARYVMGNAEWLRKVGEWINKSSPVKLE